MRHSSRRARGSTPTPGSSSSRTGGRESSVQARPSFCFIPPESRPARRPVKGPSPVKARSSSYRAALSSWGTERSSA